MFEINFNLTFDSKSQAPESKSVSKDVLQEPQTLGDSLWPRTVMYYSNDQIEKDRTSQISLSFFQKGWFGATSELKGFLPKVLVTALIIKPVLNKVLDAAGFSDEVRASKDVCSYGIAKTGIIAPAIEELLFRGIFQNSLKLAQQKMRFYTPACLKGRITHWMTSPQARILTVNALFAAAHLRNGGSYLSLRAAIHQAIYLLLFSQEAGLYETTDNLVAPFAAHATNNTLVYLIGCVALNK